MIALELIKNGYAPLYSDYVDFLLPEEGRAILAIPFATHEVVHLRAQVLAANYAVARMTVVTMGYEYEGALGPMELEAIPFWLWASVLE